MNLRQMPIGLQAGDAWLEALYEHTLQPLALALIVSAAKPLRQRGDAFRFVRRLHAGAYATLSVDLLSLHEHQRIGEVRYNIPLLTARLQAVLAWVAHQPTLHGLPLAACAGGTAGAALVRASERLPAALFALACCGGRPDLAGAGPLRALQVPLRMIVPLAMPEQRLCLLRQAHRLLGPAHDWQALTGAGEFFGEPGMQEACAELAIQWFERHRPAAVPAREAQ